MARGDVNFCGVRKAALCAVTGGAEQSVCAQKNVKKKDRGGFCDRRVRHGVCP